MTRPVILDDTDSRIQYAGDWVLSTRNPILGAEEFGSIYEGTTHGLMGRPGGLTVTFEGKSVTVLGSFTATSVELGSDIICSVDDSTVHYNSHPSTGNNQVLCTSEELEDGEHVLLVQFTKSSGTDTAQFWFDRLQYLPHNSGTVPDGTRQLVLPNDPGLVFSSGWEEASTGFSGMERRTNVNGSKLTFAFQGTSVAWIGSIQPGTSVNSSLAYSIDGANPTLVLLGPLASNLTQFNQTIFSIPVLLPAKHTLDVIYSGSVDTVSLSLDYLYISSPHSAKIGEVEMREGAIGGVLGLLVLLLSGFIIFNWRRWRAIAPRQRSSILGQDTKPEDVISPFTQITSTLALSRERKPALSAANPSSDTETPPAGSVQTREQGQSCEGVGPSSKSRRVRKAVRFGSESTAQRIEHEAESEERRENSAIMPSLSVALSKPSSSRIQS
ncbi:hypothetical protein H0H87_009579 [Tephrocybe sp. NHM501043]|nr:hypothetical protein H0H87_009579 [Tephrocybe sp. NHM501043]